MAAFGRVLVGIAAGLVALGGLYDLFVPSLPRNLESFFANNERARKLVRELLRALGGALVTIGIVSLGLVITGIDRSKLGLVLFLIVPAELINAACMYRVKSPYYVPLGFVALALLGAAFCAGQIGR